MLNLTAASVALAALGPGGFSVDRLLGIHDKLTPLQRAGLAAGVGIGAAALQLALFWRPTDSKAKPEEVSSPAEPAAA